MSAAITLVVFGYIAILIGGALKKLAGGVTTACGAGLMAAAFWVSTPDQWYRIGSVTVWIGIFFGVVALAHGAIQEAS